MAVWGLLLWAYLLAAGAAHPVSVGDVGVLQAMDKDYCWNQNYASSHGMCILALVSG